MYTRANKKAPNVSMKCMPDGSIAKTQLWLATIAIEDHKQKSKRRTSGVRILPAMPENHPITQGIRVRINMMRYGLNRIGPILIMTGIASDTINTATIMEFIAPC
jgi:hypothetical protein